MLDEKIKKYEGVRNVSIQSKVIIGEPTDEIIKYANNEKITDYNENYRTRGN